MRLALFYATGLAGIQLIEQALVEKNQVIAYALHPSKNCPGHERLVIVESELSNDDVINQTVNGADAVISVLGPEPGEDSDSRPLSLYGLSPD